jgi:uncharacterized protein YjbI with pentapeptide repeats
MANAEHANRLRRGVKQWNRWRKAELVIPDLQGMSLINFGLARADLTNSILSHTDLWGANLSEADLSFSNLTNSNLVNADLAGANLTGVNLDFATLQGTTLVGATLQRASLQKARILEVDLTEADLSHTNLTEAQFRYSDLELANLCHAYLALTEFRTTTVSDADFTGATFDGSSFIDTDIGSAIGLETCRHNGPSAIDYRSLQISGQLPIQFLRGVGLSDVFIDYLPSLFDSAIRFYSCFISYSTIDDEFVGFLYEHLQNHGIRCWFASHDMPIGGKILDEIDSAIRLRDRVLLILSEHSIKSDWVEDEVTKAFDEERRRGQPVLFPIRLDDAVMDTNEAWAAKLRARHIGDFRRWKEHDEYQKSFARVLRDLTVKKPQP